MADDNYAIKVSFTGIDEAIADVKKLQAAVSGIGGVSSGLGSVGKIEAAQLASNAKVEAARLTSEAKVAAVKIASEAKVSVAEIGSLTKLEAAEIASAVKVTTANIAAISKLESAQLASNAKVEAAKIASETKLELAERKRIENAAKAAANAASKASKPAPDNSAAILAQLEKQRAASAVRASDGSDKEAARIAQETLRFKQQIAAINAKLIDPKDIADAKALAVEINKLNLDKIKKGFDDASPVTFSQFIGATTEKARDLAEQLQQTSFVLERIGTSFNQVSQAAGQAFLAFDSARVKVGSLSKDSQGLANTSKQLVGELKNQSTSTSVLAANYQILSSGFNKTADVTNITRASLIGATAGFTDTATVADALTSVLNAYGKSASESSKIIDQFIVTQDRGKTTVADFAQNLGNVGPIAASAGVSFEEVQGALATLTLQGVKSDTAITNIKNVISDIVAPSKQAQKAFEGIGITNAASTLRTEGLVGVLQRLKDAGVDSGDEIAKFFGDIRSQSGVAGLLKGDLQAFREITADITNRGGKALQDFNAIADSSQGKLTSAINKINEALVNLGQGTVTAFQPLVSAVASAVDVFNLLPQPIQAVAGLFVGLAGGVFTFGAALTAIGAAAPAFVGGLKLLTGATGALGIATGTTTTLTAAEASAFGGVGTSATGATGGVTALTTATSVLGTTAAATTVKLGLIGAAAAVLANAGNILAQRFNAAETTKSLDDLEQKLIQIDIKRNKLNVPEVKDDKLGNNNRIQFDPFGQNLGRQKEVIAFADQQKRLDAILNESVGVLKQYGLQSENVASKQKLGADGIKNFTESVNVQKEKIAATIESLQDQASKANDNPALRAQLNSTIAIFSQRKKLLDDRVKFVSDASKKEVEAINTVTDAEKDRAKILKAEQNQDAEKNIKRSFDDGKLKRDIANAKIIQGIEEKNAISKGELDRKQALQTESLKEKQAIALQDKQRAFDDAQSAKKLAAEEALDAKKRANEAKLQSEKQAFDDSQQSKKQAFDAALNEANKSFAEAERADDEAAANKRAERDKQNEIAVSGAKQLLSDEGKVGTATPEEKAKIKALVDEENRIRKEAAASGTGGAQSQEALLARAKQIAQVQAITTQEEQTKVQLALDALDTANKAKQAEIDKAEDAKRTAAKQAADSTFQLAQQAAQKLFDEQQKNEAKVFDDSQKAAALAFEQTVLKPEKIALEKQLQADKLLFESGQLAELKRAQLAEEKALKLQQLTEENALKKQQETELDAIKQKQKDIELAKDRAFEDAKIERERSFKAEQRALDKASAIEIQGILGETAKQLIAAVAQGKSSISAAVGAGKIPAFAKGVTNFRGGAALVGERGAELVTLPRGSNVIPARQTSQIMTNNSKQFVVNVNGVRGDGMAIAAQVQRELARSAAVNSGI